VARDAREQTPAQSKRQGDLMVFAPLRQPGA
jgi:hypothetical protein